MSHGKGDIISAIKEHIDIPDYLESCGYHIRKHGSKGKLTLKEHDSFVYDPARKRLLLELPRFGGRYRRSVWLSQQL